MKLNSIYDTSKETVPDGGGSAADRVLDILEFLAERKEPQTLSQIVEALAIPKASAHRLLAVLLARGYLSRPRQRGGYALGLRLLPLAARVGERLDIVGVAEPYLRSLAAASGESCQISVRTGSRALCVARAASPEHPDVALAGGVGSMFPLHAVAVGKVLLAFAPELVRKTYVGDSGALVGFTPGTQVDGPALVRELVEIRRTGLAYDNEEYKRGLAALATPLFGAEGSVVAALAVPFVVGTMAKQMQIDTLETLAQQLRATSAAISIALGYSTSNINTGRRDT